MIRYSTILCTLLLCAAGVWFLRGEAPDAVLRKAVRFYELKEYDQAFPLLERLTKQDNPDACYYLGTMYEDGLHVERSRTTAFRLYKRSADYGNFDGMVSTGRCYEYGIGVDSDCGLAADYYDRASDVDSYAAMTLGGFYLNGGCVSSDRKAAQAYYEKAIELGGMYGDLSKAIMAYEGLAGPADLADAFVLFSRHDKSEIAQYYLGRMFFKGLGVKKDLATSFRYTKQSAENGFAGAMYALAVMYLKGNGTEKKADHGFLWASEAFINGNAHSTYLLGYCYEFGVGVLRDLDKAAAWYEKALQLDIGQAEAALKRVRRKQ